MFWQNYNENTKVNTTQMLSEIKQEIEIRTVQSWVCTSNLYVHTGSIINQNQKCLPKICKDVNTSWSSLVINSR